LRTCLKLAFPTPFPLVFGFFPHLARSALKSNCCCLNTIRVPFPVTSFTGCPVFFSSLWKIAFSPIEVVSGDRCVGPVDAHYLSLRWVPFWTRGSIRDFVSELYLGQVPFFVAFCFSPLSVGVDFLPNSSSSILATGLGSSSLF